MVVWMFYVGVDDGVETWGGGGGYMVVWVVHGGVGVFYGLYMVVWCVLWVVHGGVGVFYGLYMVVWVFFLVFTCWVNCCVGITQWLGHVVCVGGGWGEG